ncbi:hypothetical protein T12_4374 [Trichinella patagoniensis]|uniref:Uncharacterized protein n=1 Tax=Trichinella patagoniensis TaxID=990121 RepID=A0A0V0ZGE6_9BILA|nr:hypothetical protein T12_1335 [Trichinella patagoniensis]KRY11561.1 hypothetical protein T12_4374 [Trichinella patagoniensis]
MLDCNRYMLNKVCERRDHMVVHFDRLKLFLEWQQNAETWKVGRNKRSACRPAWLQYFLFAQGTVSIGRALHDRGSRVADAGQGVAITVEQDEEEE